MRDDFIQATSQPNMDALKIFGGVLVAIGCLLPVERDQAAMVPMG